MSVPPGDEFTVRDPDGVTVVEFAARTRIDEQIVGRLGDLLGPLADRPGCRLVLDLGPVTFVSSSVLGLLIRLHMRLTAGGGRLSVRNLRPDIQQVFAAVGFDRLFGGDDDPNGGAAGVTARTRPPTPTGGGSVALPPPADQD